jgi:PhzF family phenazine biosynthesis protein
MKYYIVDAFTDRPFGGNPAGVCLLDEWLSVDRMQNIAMENNLSETAFLVKRNGYYDLRWFTPANEVDLCGHATLGSAFVLFKFVELTANVLEFHTQSGLLTVERKGDMLWLDFPSRKPKPIEVTAQMEQAIGCSIIEAHLSMRDMLLLLKDENQVKNASPDFDALRSVASHAVIITAKGKDVDFVSRFFAPNYGVPEDPVTGSAHCVLIPFWSGRLGKTSMKARQLSKRGGQLWCEDAGERVKIGGKAVLYMSGEILI